MIRDEIRDIDNQDLNFCDKTIKIEIENLNSYYANKLISCFGKVLEISPTLKDKSAQMYIKYLKVISLKKNHTEINIASAIKVITCFDQFVLVKLGDIIEITGIYRPHQVNFIRNKKLSKFEYVIQAKTVRILNEIDLLKPNNEEISFIKKLSKKPNIQKRIASSIFPEIFGRDDIKMMCALIIFMNHLKSYNQFGISLLLIGEPGTSKSKILGSLRDLFPNLVYEYNENSDIKFECTNTKYKIEGTPWKRTGLIDLANKGLIIIDNLEERKPYHIKYIEDVLSNRSMKSSIISAVRIEENKYNFKIPVVDNLKMSKKKSLIRNFDMIFILVNKPNKLYDILEVEYILSIGNNDKEDIISQDLLKKYITYARNNYNPELSSLALIDINEFFNKIKALSRIQRDYYINDRYLIILVSLSKAFAKMALRNKVLRGDVKEIIRLFNRYLYDIGFYNIFKKAFRRMFLFKK